MKKEGVLFLHRRRAARPHRRVQVLTEVWRAVRQTWCSTPGRVLFGNYTGQVSLRGMVESAERC